MVISGLSNNLPKRLVGKRGMLNITPEMKKKAPRKRFDLRMSDMNPETLQKIKFLAGRSQRLMHRQAQFMIEEYIKIKKL